MLLVVDFNNAPRISAAADLTALGIGDLVVRTHHSEGYLGHDFMVLRNRLLVIEFISRALEYLDPMELDVGQNLHPVSMLLLYDFCSPHPLLEVCNLFICQGIRFGDHWDEVDLGMQLGHDLDVQGLQRVASRLNEIDTSVHPVGIDVLDNWPPSLLIVHKVSKARRINDRQP